MVGKKIEDVNANRMELLIIRRRIALAEKGHKLLSEKRDAMVMQFMEMLEEYEKNRKSVLERLQNAYETLRDTEMLMGESRLEELAYRIPPIEKLALSTKNIIGVKIPRLEEIELHPMEDFQYGLLDTTAKLDAAVMRFREILPDIIALAVYENGLDKMAREIEKTKRRVNALEYIFIPKFKNTKRYIEMALSERERQDFFRRKKIKALLMEK